MQCVSSSGMGTILINSHSLKHYDDTAMTVFDIYIAFLTQRKQSKEHLFIKNNASLCGDTTFPNDNTDSGDMLWC